MTSDIAAVELGWLRPCKRLPYCPIFVWLMALYFQKEQEDSLRKEFRKIDLAIGVKYDLWHCWSWISLTQTFKKTSILSHLCVIACTLFAKGAGGQSQEGVQEDWLSHRSQVWPLTLLQLNQSDSDLLKNSHIVPSLHFIYKSSRRTDSGRSSGWLTWSWRMKPKLKYPLNCHICADIFQNQKFLWKI